MREIRYTHVAVFYLLIGAYIVTRFWGLTDSCLWFDEIFSIHAAEHTWSEILNFVALDLIHPPLFYLVLKVWMAVGGESLFWLRLLPVVFSIVAVYPFVALHKELKISKGVVFISLLLLTVNGSLLKYSQEVRMYSMLMCISLFSMWLFARYFIKGKSFVPLVIVNILLVYTHYFGWFVVGSEVAAILIFQRIKWRRMSVMFAVVLATFIPWLIAVWQAARASEGLTQNIGWMQRPGLTAIAQLKLNLIEPFYYQASTVDPISIFRISLPILAIVAVAVILYLVRWKEQSEDNRRAVGFLFVLTVLPIVAALAASWLLPYSIWGTRHLIIVFVPVAMTIAIALKSISTNWLKTASITLILLLSGYAFALKTQRPVTQYSWCAWEPLTRKALAEQNTSIYTVEDLIAYHVWFPNRDAAMNNSIFRVKNIGGLAEDKAYFLPRGFDGVQFLDASEIKVSRFWLVYRDLDVKETEPPVRNLIVAGYHIADTKMIAADKEKAIAVLMER